MLEVFFCNVGDGDAVLIRELREEGTDYAVLVDAGRPYVESRRGPCARTPWSICWTGT